MRVKMFWNPQFFLFLFDTVQREDATIKSWNSLKPSY